MIKFGLGDFETNYYDFAKHYKQIGLHVKRVYNDGSVKETENEKLKSIIKENESLLISKTVHITRGDSSELTNATDYYLPLNNLEYDDGNIPYYSIGAMNTKQTVYARMKFIIDDCTFILNDLFKSSGSHGSTFYDVYIDRGYIEDVIEDIIEENKKLNKEFQNTGIQKGQDDDYLIIALDDTLNPIEFEISKNDLLRSLVGIEVYKFEQEITNELE